MNPQDTVERVLKEIHIAFSKCENYNDESDKIIMDRKQFIELLDRLNSGIYDMMENYEQTKNGREIAERAFKKKGEDIIKEASDSAEDIYAASVIYTADAIGKIRDLMDQTNESMNDLFRQFKKELKEQKDVLKGHETELESQLTDLADSKKYLTIIREVNTQRNRKNRDLKAEREAGLVYKQNLTHMPTARTEKPEKAVDPEDEQKKAEAPDIRVNKEAEYFKWKAAQKGEQEAEEAETSENAENKAEEENAADGKRPSEEEIRRRVLEDERAAAAADVVSGVNQNYQPERRKEGPGAGQILRNIIFGKPED